MPKLAQSRPYLPGTVRLAAGRIDDDVHAALADVVLVAPADAHRDPDDAELRVPKAERDGPERSLGAVRTRCTTNARWKRVNPFGAGSIPGYLPGTSSACVPPSGPAADKARTAVMAVMSCSIGVVGGRHWTRTSDLLHVKQVL